MHDCERLIQEFFPAISTISLQIYFTALPFTPSGTELYKTFASELDNSAKVKSMNTREEEWSPCLQVIVGHSDCVQSVSFSPDGTRIVSGSMDNTVRLWDAVTGAHLQTLKGHSDEVQSVSFSPDGTNIVSRSYANTMLWDAVTGAHLQTFMGDYLGHTWPYILIHNGWLCSTETSQKLCWIPVTYRRIMATNKNTVVLRDQRYHLLLLDLKALLVYKNAM